MARSNTGSAGVSLMLGTMSIIGASLIIYGGALILPMAWGSYSSYMDRIRAREANSEQIRIAYQAETADQLCPEYNAASFWKRHIEMRNISWCADYAD